METTSFKELVVIHTKLAGVLPFIIGVLFASHLGYAIDWANTVILIAVTLLLAIATSAIGRLRVDAKTTANDVEIGEQNLPVFLVQLILVVMLTAATCLGVWLVWRTNLFLLLLGVVAFSIALFYTIGPVPLSRLPLGEVFVGSSLGLLLPFTAAYVNVPSHELAGIMLHWPGLLVSGNLWSLLAIVLLCTPMMATTANLVFAENILRLNDNQVIADKHTLPDYLGRHWSVVIYRSFLVIGYLGVAIGMAVGMLSWWLAVIVAALPAVFMNDRRLMKAIQNGTKVGDDTENTVNTNRWRNLRPAISNLVWINGLLVVGLLLEMVMG